MKSEPKRRAAPGIGARLLAAFGAVTLAFGVATIFAARAQRQALAQLDDVLALEDTARSALRLSSLVRDQYMHQAHVIVRGEPSHVALYEEAGRQVRVQLGELSARPLFAPEQDELARILKAAKALDRVFLHQILPSVEAADWPKVRSEHERAQSLVAEITASVTRVEQSLAAQVTAARARAQALSRRALWVTLLLFASAVLVGAVAVTWAVKSIVHPLRGLEAGAARIGAGDLSARIPVRSRDEVGRLGERFNRMAEQLATHQERLVAAEKLAGLGRLAAGVAHELNNPLGVVLGYTRLMAKSAPPALRADLEVIDDEVVRAHRIVQDLLGLAREGQPPRVEPLDLGALIADVVERQRASGEAGGAKLELVPLPPLPALGDPDRLRQVFANLLRNAAEAAGRDGRVVVSGAATSEHAEVRIDDSGPGISEQARARLFEPFFTTRPQGTGLGLAVSLAIAQAHRGTIVAENRAGGGARFTLRLPRGDLAPSEEARA